MTDDIIEKENISAEVETAEQSFTPVKLPSKFTLFIKRAFDICSSGAVILVLTPFFLLFTPIVAVAMKGNPFFIQKRPGKNGKIFSLIKYRTMTNAKDKDGNFLPDEKRLTKFGKIMRATSIDELPELFNIFIGNMSVVGPRPLLVKYEPLYNDFQRQRSLVRPGLTGLAQVSGRNAIKWEQKFEKDVEYIGKINLLYDLGIIFKTVKKVFVREGINESENLSMEEFKGTPIHVRKRISIALIANADSAIYKFRFELVQRLLADGHAVTLITPGDQYAKQFEEAGCRLVKMTVDRRGLNPITDFKLLLSYAQFMRREKPDLVLTYTIKPNIYGGYAARRTHTTYVSNITGLGSAFERGGLFTKMIVMMYKVALKKVQMLFCQNEGDMEVVKNCKLVKENRICLLNGSGVNLSKFVKEPMPVDDNTVKFLFVGRVMKEKGVDELFESAEKIKLEYSNAVFNVIGGFEENYAAKIEELKSKGIINYFGQVNNPREYYMDSDCIVLPSWHEGMSNALLEGAATGRALIASDVHGCKEAVLDGVSGYLCKVKDAQSLYNSLKKYIELPYSERAKMGEAGRKYMEERFDRRNVVDTIIKNISVLTTGEKK